MLMGKRFRYFAFYYTYVTIMYLHEGAVRSAAIRLVNSDDPNLQKSDMLESAILLTSEL